MKQIYTILFLFTWLPFVSAQGTLVTYPGNSSYQSAIYEVRVTQNGVTMQSFVYQDDNKFTNAKSSMTDWNHWTTFSFSGSVSIEVTKLTGNIGSGEIRPSAKNIPLTVSGNKITFTLDRPEKLFIKLDSMYEHPLFIFADTVETNIPNKNDPNVVYWGPGVHDIGEHYTIESNKTYYLAGGAYLKGSFLSVNNASNVTIRGRGILSGENIAHCTYSTCKFGGVAILFQGSSATNNELEGITVINPSEYCLQSYGGDLLTHNTKFFGWWYETDGWVAGNNTQLYNAFFKVNDDVVKLYFDNLYIHDLVIYKQPNGAPFQLGWSNESGSNNLIENIDVVYDETNYNQSNLTGNRGFINNASGSSSAVVQNMTFQNIHYDQDLSYLIGINSKGIVRNFTLKNIYVKGKQLFKSYMAGGTISGFSLENVLIDGVCISKDADIDLQKAGNVSPVTYLGCASGPVVSFNTPKDGTVFPAGSDVDVQVNASDHVGTITLVKLYVNDHLLARQLTSPPFEWGSPNNTYDARLRNMNPGAYNLKTVAYNNAGDSTMATMTFVVQAANQPPIVSFSTPVNNATFPSGSDVDVLVNASDPDGTVTQVKLYVNNHLLVRQLTSPPFEWGSPTNTYDARLRNMQNGNYTLKTIAYDNSGDSSMAAISFTVSTLTNLPLSRSSKKIIAYPNPVHKTIYLKNAEDSTTWQLYDMQGQWIISGVGNRIEMTSYSPGIYHVKVGSEWIKIVKE